MRFPHALGRRLACGVAAVWFACLSTSSTVVAAHRDAEEPVVLLVVGDGGGPPDGQAQIPVYLVPVEGTKLDANAISGVDLELEWAGTLATLDELLPTAVTADWQLASNARDGHVRISMAGLTPVSPGLFGADVLVLEFVLGALSGSTELHVISTRVFDSQRLAVPHVAVDGRLSVSVVAVGVETVGGLKAGYR